MTPAGRLREEFSADEFRRLAKRSRDANQSRRLSETEMAELSAIVEVGPDLQIDGVVRWRRIDLQSVIAKRQWCVLINRSVGLLAIRLVNALLHEPAGAIAERERMIEPAGGGDHPLRRYV